MTFLDVLNNTFSLKIIFWKNLAVNGHQTAKNNRKSENTYQYLYLVIIIDFFFKIEKVSKVKQKKFRLDVI